MLFDCIILIQIVLDQLQGNKQAGDIASGLGGIGGLKKGL